MGSSGFRWGAEKGKWNLLLKDGEDGSEIEPRADAFSTRTTASCKVELDDFASGRDARDAACRSRTLTTADGETVMVTTVYDLLMAQYGVNRGLAGEYPADYDDDDAPYTPAWSEKYTGIGRDVADPLRPRVGDDGRAHRTASARSSSAPASTTGTTPT